MAVHAPIPFDLVVARLRSAGCVFAEDEARLLLGAAEHAAHLDAMVLRRTGGEPLEYVLGWAEFSGMRILVESGVFVPRRRTEFLVSEAARLAVSRSVVVDLCCGSGAVGAALSARLPSLEIYASDIDPAAVACARRNITGADRVFEGDLYDPLPPHLRGAVALLVANAPYVPTDAINLMPPEARLYEARIALDGGVDGLDLQRRIAEGASDWLVAGGHLVMETSQQQASATAELFVSHGLAARITSSEDIGGTVVIGTKPRTSGRR